MKRTVPVAVLVGLLLGWAGCGEGRRTMAPPPSAGQTGCSADAWAEPAADVAVREKLQAKIALLKFEDTPLKDAISFLRDVTELNIRVRWSALAVAGIDKATALDLHLTNVTVAKALRVILDDLGAAGMPLRYVIQDEAVTISTKEDFARDQVTRIYDVSDLIAESERRGGYGLRRIEIASDAADIGGLRVVDDQEHQGTLSRAEIVGDLIGSIVRTVASTSWERAGGPAEICERKGKLIVTQTPHNHRLLRRLLGELRACSRLKILLEFWLVGASREAHQELQNWLVTLLQKRPKPKWWDPSKEVPWDTYDATVWGSCLDSKDFRTFRRLARRLPGVMIRSLPTLACRSGDLFLLVCHRGAGARSAEGRCRMLTTEVLPLLGGEASVPPSRRHVVLTKREDWRWGPAKPRADGGIQFPTVMVNDLQTTASIPDGGVLLLVENGLEAASNDDGITERPGETADRGVLSILRHDKVYVLVFAKIATPRGPERSPAGGPGPREFETTATGRH